MQCTQADPARLARLSGSGPGNWPGSTAPAVTVIESRHPAGRHRDRDGHCQRHDDRRYGCIINRPDQVMNRPDPLLLHVLTKWAPSLLFFWCSSIESVLLALQRSSCSWTVNKGRFWSPLIGSPYTTSLPWSLLPSSGRSAPLRQPKRILCRK